MRRFWMIGLLSLAGLGLPGEEAFADRRHGGSSAQRQHHHSSRPHHHNHRHHARPHHHHHGHTHSRSYGFWAAPIFIAPPLAYYYPEPPPAVAYIERPPEPTSVVPQLNDGYWYYCPASRIYYPHVLDCANGWQRVTPR